MKKPIKRKPIKRKPVRIPKKQIYRPKKMPKIYTKPTATKKKIVSTKYRPTKAPIQMLSPRPPIKRKRVSVAKKAVKKKTMWPNGRREILQKELKSMQKLDLFAKKLKTYENYCDKTDPQYGLNKNSTDFILNTRRKKKALEMVKNYYKKLKSDPKFHMMYNKDPNPSRYAGSGYLYTLMLSYKGNYVTATKRLQMDYPVPGITK
jgi:hypothetical protein